MNRHLIELNISKSFVSNHSKVIIFFEICDRLHASSKLVELLFQNI